MFPVLKVSVTGSGSQRHVFSSCWTSALQTGTAGSTWTASGSLRANLSLTVTAASTSTPTLPTSVPTGWRPRCSSTKSNWPTNSTEAVRCCHIQDTHKLPLYILQQISQLNRSLWKTWENPCTLCIHNAHVVQVCNTSAWTRSVILSSLSGLLCVQTGFYSFYESWPAFNHPVSCHGEISSVHLYN